MVLVLDCIVVGLIFWFAMLGYKRGVLVTALGFLPMLCGIMGACFFTPVVSNILKETPLYSNMVGDLSEKFTTISNSTIDSVNSNFIENLSLPKFLLDTLEVNNNPVAYEILGINNDIPLYVASFIANACVNIISVISIYICIYIGVNLVVKALNLISRLPILNSVNRTLGMTIGIVQGVLWVWVLGIIVFLYQFTSGGSDGLELINESLVAKIFYEYNILLNFILSIFN